MDAAATQSPVVLIATEGEWAGRSLESVLEANGYAVERAEDGRDALAHALRFPPDAIIIDEQLPGIGGIAVCQRLREEPSFDPATPIIVTAVAPASRAVRAAAYRAGAWEFCTQPLDIDTVLLQLGTFIRAKRVIAEARSNAYVDASTGVFTPRGMEHWAQQLTARASRNHEALACIVLMPQKESAPETATTSEARINELNREIANLLQLSRDSFRRSDIVGRTGDGLLALLAPGTNEEGVQGLLARLRSAINAASTTHLGGPAHFTAGYWAAQDFASTPIDPAELLRRATAALEQGRRPPNENSTRAFDQRPVS